jgi:hypothetical protein
MERDKSYCGNASCLAFTGIEPYGTSEIGLASPTIASSNA